MPYITVYKCITRQLCVCSAIVSVWMAPYRLPLVVLCDEPLEFLCQVGVLFAQFGVARAVLLNLGLDVREGALEVAGDIFPFHVVLSAPLQCFLLQVGDNQR